ncbi:MAG: zinc-dependent metalloprotease [Terriglobales bacterium]
MRCTSALLYSLVFLFATAAATAQNGFIPVAWNTRTNQVEFTLTPARLQQEFLRFTGMDEGVGSLQGGGDRGTVGPTSLCRFRRDGNKVFVIEVNTRYRATRGSAELRHSVADSFPEAVLASLPILSDNGGTLVVNANPLILADTTGEARALGRGSAAAWKLDPSRSALIGSHTHAFPKNTETEALLTFTSPQAAASTAITRGIVTVKVHQSFVELPAPGYSPREFDPRVGYFTQTFEDFSQPYNQPLIRQVIDRWRLQKKDPSAAVSEPVQPITFYLDQSIPEPMRSAIRRGVLWWNQAFLQAGFKNAMVIKGLPLGADPNDFRYPTIEWTNREGRGWSVGQGQADPRTGEILHAVVELDSHRMRTMHHYWNALMPAPGSAQSLEAGIEDPGLGAFAALDGMDPHLSQEQVMVRRISLLACHEMGHVLGLAHNFLASTYGRGSVMDYFQPRVTIRADGTADLSDAYMQGVGSYDKMAIQWGYGPAAQDPAVVRKMIATGIVWGNPQDARWNAYDDGPDPVTFLQTVVPVRDALLKQFGPRMLRPGQPVSILANRFALVYMFHQYGLLAALNVIGGAEIPPTLAGDGQTPVTVWPETSQREALGLELAALAPAETQIPPALWRELAPLETNNAVERTERFRSSSGDLFDGFDGAQAIADIVVNGLLNPQRLERLETIRQESPGSHDLSTSDVIQALLHQAFPAPPNSNGLQSVVQVTVAEGLMDLAANPHAPSAVASAAWAGVLELRSTLAQQPREATIERLQGETARFIRNPQQFAPRQLPTPAPVGPPVGGGT